MPLFGIFKTQKISDAVPEFIGQINDPTLAILSEIASKTTGGEKRTGATCCDGDFISVTTENHHIDLVEKSQCLDLIRGCKK